LLLNWRSADTVSLAVAKTLSTSLTSTIRAPRVARARLRHPRAASPRRRLPRRPARCGPPRQPARPHGRRQRPRRPLPRDGPPRRPQRQRRRGHGLRRRCRRRPRRLLGGSIGAASSAVAGLHTDPRVVSSTLAVASAASVRVLATTTHAVPAVLRLPPLPHPHQGPERLGVLRPPL